MIPAAPEGTFRVVTWNLWWRFGDDPDARHRAIGRVLGEVRPDVLCLQEVHGTEAGADRSADLATSLDLRHVRSEHPSFRGEIFANAVLSRWPVLDRGQVALVDGSGQPGHRSAVWARLDAPFGPMPVISTHLAFRFDESELRQQQATQLLELVDELRGDPDADPPVLIGADLNALPDSDELRLLTGRRPAPVRGLVMTDAWPQVREDPGHTWDRRVPYLANSAWPQRRLDYVLVSWPRPRPLGNPVQAFLIGDDAVDGIWPSDHLGVAVDLRVR
ncbi:MAG: endonuclease/exonuclease/phosphatase family protein [Actinomycetota bacterium]